MSVTPFSFVIDTEVSPGHFDELLKFINQNYILPLQKHFTNVKKEVIDNTPVLTFTALGPKGKWQINVEIKAGKPIHVEMIPSDATVPKTALDRLKEDLIIGVQLFEEKVRRTTLYFAWVEGEQLIPEKRLLRRRKFLDRLLFDSMLLLFVIFIAINISLFIIFGPIAALMLVAFQFMIILFSSKIITGMGDWLISKENPKVHIMQYQLPVEEHEEFRKKYPRELLVQMKREIYEKTLAVGKELDCQVADEVLSKYGFKCIPENLSAKTVNVYEIVKNAAEKFNLPIPKIAISNTILPNAATSGPSPRFGIVLITTGLLVQLEEDEILSVVGHEFSHLKGRDPLALFGLFAAEYLLRVYVLWPFIYLFGFFYVLLALGAVYFVAKFFEARADLESAIRIGQPQVLAEALRKIGFRRLQFERLPAYRVQEWVGWDPHPPVYFRIARLEKLQAPVDVRHPFFQSIRDTINGFFSSF